MKGPMEDDLLPGHADIDQRLADTRRALVEHLAAGLDLNAGLAAIFGTGPEVQALTQRRILKAPADDGWLAGIRARASAAHAKNSPAEPIRSPQHVVLLSGAGFVFSAIILFTCGVSSSPTQANIGLRVVLALLGLVFFSVVLAVRFSVALAARAAAAAGPAEREPALNREGVVLDAAAAGKAAEDALDRARPERVMLHLYYLGGRPR